MTEKAKDVQEYIMKQRQAIAANPECGTSHYNLALGLLALKRFEEAEKELFEAVDCSPTLAEAYVQLGGIALKRGDTEGCLEFNKRAIKCRAGFAEGYGNIGFVELQRGNADEAIFNLEKAIRWNPNFIQARATLANAYLMKGRVDESIQTNLKVIEQEPDFAVAYNNLAIAYLEKGDTEAAASHLQKAEALGYAVDPELKAEIEKQQ